MMHVFATLDSVLWRNNKHSCVESETPPQINMWIYKIIYKLSIDNIVTEIFWLTGATIFPVCPTWRSFGTNPASTAALEAPTAAPNRSASSYSSLKFSPFLRPRPPEITTLALVNSGRSLLIFSWLIHREISFLMSPVCNCLKPK